MSIIKGKLLLKNVKIGQEIYISNRSMFYVEEPRIDTFIVTKTNTTSVYVKRPNSEIEIRIDKKTGKIKSFLGEYGACYLSENDFWNEIKRQEDTKTLRSEIIKKISNLCLEDLEEIKELLLDSKN